MYTNITMRSIEFSFALEKTVLDLFKRVYDVLYTHDCSHHHTFTINKMYIYLKNSTVYFIRDQEKQLRTFHFIYVHIVKPWATYLYTTYVCIYVKIYSTYIYKFICERWAFAIVRAITHYIHTMRVYTRIYKVFRLKWAPRARVQYSTLPYVLCVCIERIPHKIMKRKTNKNGTPNYTRGTPCDKKEKKRRKSFSYIRYTLLCVETRTMPCATSSIRMYICMYRV